MNGLSNSQSLLGGNREFERMFRSSTIGFLQPALLIGSGWFLIAWGLAFVFASSDRFLLCRPVYSSSKDAFFLSPAVIGSAHQAGRWLAEQPLNWQTSGLHLVRFADKKNQPPDHSSTNSS